MKSKIKTTNKRTTAANAASSAKSWIGKPVCAVLKDGTYYVGRVEAVKNGELVLSGLRGTGRLQPGADRANRAKVSGFMDSLLGGESGGGGAEQAIAGDAGAFGGGGGGGVGGIGGIMSTIKLGMNMIQMLMPLLSFFKI